MMGVAKWFDDADYDPMDVTDSFWRSFTCYNANGRILGAEMVLLVTLVSGRGCS